MPDHDAHPPAASGQAEAWYQEAGRLAGERGGFDGTCADLLRRAAEAGHARAAFHLGLLHAKGEAGLARDAAAARRWCTAAAQLGLGVAQFNLALLEADGAADGDARSAERWLLAAAANGIGEADACLDLLYREAGQAPRPRSWEEAETRASVALARSDPDAPKTVRFAEYYVDPCLDLLSRRLSLRREQCEDIVQEFFLELEEPLAKGAQRGTAWKEAMRRRFQPGAGGFRPFLARALVNFARDWLRRERSAQEQELRPPEPAAAEASVRVDQEHVRDAWSHELERFRQEHAGLGELAERAVGMLAAQLVQGGGLIAMAERAGLTERTVRRDLAVATGLLQRWIGRQLDALPGGDPLHDALRQGAELIPTWLHRCTDDKRARLLCYLALLHHRRGPRPGAAEG